MMHFTRGLVLGGLLCSVVCVADENPKSNKPADALARVAALSDKDSEVLAALTSLGYSVIEAQTAIQSLPKDAPDDVEERLRMALQNFTGK